MQADLTQEQMSDRIEIVTDLAELLADGLSADQRLELFESVVDGLEIERRQALKERDAESEARAVEKATRERPVRYMTAIRPESQHPELLYVMAENGDDYVGHWANGAGWMDVRMPKAQTRLLTADEHKHYSEIYRLPPFQSESENEAPPEPTSEVETLPTAVDKVVRFPGLRVVSNMWLEEGTIYATDKTLAMLDQMTEGPLATPYKMYVWRRAYRWIVMVHARNVAEARELAIEDSGGPGDESTPVRQEMIRTVCEQSPEIHYRECGEAVILTNGLLEEEEMDNSRLRLENDRLALLLFSALYIAESYRGDADSPMEEWRAKVRTALEGYNEDALTERAALLEREKQS